MTQERSEPSAPQGHHTGLLLILGKCIKKMGSDFPCLLNSEYQTDLTSSSLLELSLVNPVMDSSLVWEDIERRMNSEASTV